MKPGIHEEEETRNLRLYRLQTYQVKADWNSL